MDSGGGIKVEVRPGVNACEVIVKGLSEIATQTVSQLEEIWNEVGCNRDERSQHLQGGSVLQVHYNINNASSP